MVREIMRTRHADRTRQEGLAHPCEGIGHCALGYIDGDVPETAPRKENRVFYIKQAF